MKAFETFFLIKTYLKKLMRFSSIEFNVRNLNIDLKHNFYSNQTRNTLIFKNFVENDNKINEYKD